MDTTTKESLFVMNDMDKEYLYGVVEINIRVVGMKEK